MAEAVNSPADVEREPDVGPVPDEQPTAPYLDAVVAYAFRGPARYHVPGPQGRPGRRSRRAQGDRRSTRLAADVPQDIHGIDLGPSPTPVRARRAARRRGVRRGAHVLPHQRRDPGQPRAVPRARAARARGSSPSATRTRRSSTGSCSAAGSRASSRPSTTTELGHHALRDAGRARGARWRARRTRARRSSSRRPTTAWPPTSPGCAEVAHARRGAAGRRPVVGPALRLPRGACRRPRCRRARTRCSRARTRSPAR